MSLAQALGATSPDGPSDQGYIDPQGVASGLMVQHEPDADSDPTIDPTTVAQRLLRKHAGASGRIVASGVPSGTSGTAPGSFDPSTFADQTKPGAFDPTDFGTGPAEGTEGNPATGNVEVPPTGNAVSVGAEAAARSAATQAGQTMKMAARGLPAMEQAEQGAFSPLNENLLTNPPKAEDSGAFQAGEAVTNFGKQIGPTPQEEAAHPIASMVGGALGGVAAPLALGALNPVAGIAGGAALFGASSAEDTYEEAKKHGASDETASQAALLSGAVNAALGSLPIASVLQPVAKILPQASGYVMQILAQAAKDGIVFASVGEAQQYIGEQIAKMYDPNAGYSFSTERLISEFLAGGALGGLHAAFQRGDVAPAEQQQQPPQAQPQPNAGAGGFSDANDPKYWQSNGSFDYAAYQGDNPGYDRNADPNPWQQGAQQQGPGAQQSGAGAQQGAQAAPPPEPFKSALNPKLRSKLEQKAAYYKEHSAADIASWDDDKLKDYVNEKFGGGSARPSDDDILRQSGMPDEDIKGMSPEEKAAAASAAVQNGQFHTEGAQPGTVKNPVDLKTTEDVARAAAVADQDHTPAQGEAGNAQRGHATWNGLGIAIEVPPGGVRRGTVKGTNQTWESTHPDAYGEFKDLPDAADGMKPDVIIGSHPNAPTVYVIDELDRATGKYKQSKAFIGFSTPAAAAQSYAGISTKSVGQIAGMRAFGRDEFVAWAKKGGLSKPASDAAKAPRSNNVSPKAAEGSPKGPQSTSQAPSAEQSPPSVGDYHRIEEVLRAVGVDPRHVRPVDIQRAAEIHANEGYSPEDAFQLAVTRAAVEDGLMTPQDVKDDHNEEVAAAVGAGLTPQHPARDESRGSATGGEAAAGAGERIPGGSENGASQRNEAGARPEGEKPVRPAGGEAAELHGEAAGTGGAENAGRPGAEQRPAGGERAAEADERGTERKAPDRNAAEHEPAGAAAEAAVNDEVRETLADAYMDSSPGEQVMDTAIDSVRGHIKDGEERAPSGASWKDVLAELERRKKSSPGATVNAKGDLVVNRHKQIEAPAGADLIGGEHTVTAADGTKIKVKPQVVEAKDLITSTDKGYDKTLQPRQRDRAASHAQIREIATNLDPERLGYSAEADRGAPIVGPDRMVESGNGRVAALRVLYRANPAKAKLYKDWLKSQGVDVAKYKEPVLVRQRVTALDHEGRKAFTVAANQAATLSMSAPERAIADADNITPHMLDLIRDGDLGSLENRGFVRALIGTLPASERGNLASTEGGLSAEGLARVKNAVLAKAFGDPDIVSRITESTDDDVKSISNALVAAAPSWAKLRSDIEVGSVPEEFDLTKPLMEAVKRTADMRSKGQKLDEYLAQHDAFDHVNPDVDGFIRNFYDPGGKRSKSAARIADFLRYYANEAAKVSAEAGLDLGLPKVGPHDIQAAASKETQESRGNSVRPGEQNERPSKRGRGAGEGGAGADGEQLPGSKPRRGFAEPDDLFASEPGADDRPQLIFPGAERIASAELAKRRAAEPLRPKKAQKAPDEGLFARPAEKQIDLEEAIAANKGAPPATPEPKKVSEPVVSSAPAKPTAKIDDFGEKIGGARKDIAAPSGERKSAKPEAVDERPTWAKRFSIQPVEIKRSTEGETGQRWEIHDERTGKPLMDPVVRWKPYTFATKEEAEHVLPLAAVALKHRVVGGADNTFRIIRDVTDRKRVTIKDGFPDREAALRYLHDHATRVLETKTGFGEEIIAAPDKVKRVGVERRTEDANEKSFADTFGFRGVEFGNWNNQVERQEVMNHAFDGLLDLAHLLNVPPKALSLNGELAIAFGARGHGLAGARAHYERDYGVINLTKMSGAGSLAHEWMHAFDAYLARLDTKASSNKIKNERGDEVYDTSGRDADYISHGIGYKSQLRDALKAALKDVSDTIKTKAENYVEDTEQADKWLRRAKDRLGDTLNDVRADIAKKREYGTRHVNPANVEQLARFDALADKLRNGDDVVTSYKLAPSKTRMGVTGRHTNDTIDALSGLYKEVRGRSGFHEGQGPIDRIVHAVTDFKKRLDMMEQAAKGSEKTRLVPTQFARDAYNLDQGRSSDYWSTPHELMARAMSSYVEDKIAAQGGRSDFLSYGSDNALYRIFNARPFPEGEERQVINAALDRLFSTLQVQEGAKPGSLRFAEPEERFVAPPPRERGIPVEARAPIADFQSADAIKKHPDYAAAKSGDGEAAIRLVRDLIKPESIALARSRFGEGAVYVPVHGEERTGRNAIPMMMAVRYANGAGGTVGHDIIQANKAFHTGAGPMERLANRAVFSGKVEEGKNYVLVDDTSVMGSTLADLADHIQRNGGKVKGVALIANAGRASILTPTNAAIRDIERRHSNAVKDLFGIAPSGLTADEAAYLRNFRDADGLRASLAKAQRERAARLGAKGLREGPSLSLSTDEENGASSGAVSVSGPTAETRPYGNAADNLMGFRKEGLQRGYDETKYRHEQPVKITFPDGLTFFDAIKGLNKPHAMERARRNWDGAKIEPAQWSDVEKQDQEDRARETGLSDSRAPEGVPLFEGRGPGAGPKPPAPMAHAGTTAFEPHKGSPIAKQAQEHVLARGRDTGNEHLIAIDDKGKIAAQIGGSVRNVDLPPDLIEHIAKPETSLVVHHNHPKDSTLSNQDIAMLGFPGLRAVWAHGHGGRVSRAALTDFGRSLMSNNANFNVNSLNQIIHGITYGYLFKPLKEIVDRGAIDVHRANDLLAYGANEVLRRAGLIDYATNDRFDGEIESLNLNPLIDHATRELTRSIPNAYTQTPTHGDDGRTGRVLGHPGDVGVAFEGSAKTPGRDDQQAVANPQRGVRDRGEEGAQLSLLGGDNPFSFYEDTGPFTKAPGGGGSGQPPKGGRSSGPSPQDPLHPASWSIRRKLADMLGSDAALTAKEKLQDFNARVERLQNMIEARSRNWVSDSPESPLPDEHQFYTLKRLFPGKRSQRMRDFNEEHVKALDALLRDAGISGKEAGEFLYAKHATERNRVVGALHDAKSDFNKATRDPDIVGASGMSNKEAREILGAAMKGPKAEAFRELARQVGEIRKFIQGEMLRGGLESQDALSEWNRTYNDYVPLRGWEDPGEQPSSATPSGRSGGGDIKGPESKRALGRRTKADNPLVGIIDQAYRTIDRAEKNLALQGLARMLNGAGDDVRKEMGVTLERGRPKRTVDPSTGLVKTVDDNFDRMRENAVHMKVNGKDQYVVFDDARLAQAAKRWSPYSNSALAFMNRIMSRWKSALTHYNPLFMPRHMARYFVEGTLNAFEQKEHGDFSALKYMADAFPLIGNTTRAILARERGTPAGEMGQYWDEMKAGGGATSMFSMRDYDELLQRLRSQAASIGTSQYNPRKVLRAVSELVDKFTGVIDNSTRLAAFAQARKAGKSIQQASMIAREATVDYNLRGWWSNILAIWAPFQNVATQTGYRMGSAARRSHIMRKVFLSMFALGFASAVWNYAFGGEDKDKTAFFDKLPEWTRSKALAMFLGLSDDKGRPQPVIWPFPFNYAFPLTAGQAAAGMMFGTASKAKYIAMMLSSFVSSFSELGEQGVAWRDVSPEMIRPFMDTALNKSWTGSHIHTPADFQKAPNAESGFRWTPEFWKDISQFLNHYTGGDRRHSGYLDFYPEDVEYILKSYLGGQVRPIEEGANAVGAIRAGQLPDPTQIPIGSVFYGANYDKADQAAQRERTYDQKHRWEGRDSGPHKPLIELPH